MPTECQNGKKCGKYCSYTVPWDTDSLLALLKSHVKFAATVITVKYNNGKIFTHFLPCDILPRSYTQFMLSQAGWCQLEEKLDALQKERQAVIPCVFLDEDKRCMIYDLRPPACKQFGESP